MSLGIKTKVAQNVLKELNIRAFVHWIIGALQYWQVPGCLQIAFVILVGNSVYE